MAYEDEYTCPRCGNYYEFITTDEVKELIEQPGWEVERRILKAYPEYVARSNYACHTCHELVSTLYAEGSYK